MAGKVTRKRHLKGWERLGPITLLLEYRFGLRPNVYNNRLVWDVHETSAFGVKRYPFGKNGLLDLACLARAKLILLCIEIVATVI